MTKAPFLRRRRLAALAIGQRGAPPRAPASFGWRFPLLVAFALLFAFSEVTLYDLIIHPLASLRHLTWGAGALFVTMIDALPYLLTAATLWLAGGLAWLLVGQKFGSQS